MRLPYGLNGLGGLFDSPVSGSETLAGRIANHPPFIAILERVDAPNLLECVHGIPPVGEMDW